MRELLVVSISAMLTIACAGRPAPAPTDRPRVGAATPEDRTCSRDSECVLVDDCCGCSLGGQRLAIASARRADLEASADDACAARRCVATPREHASCRAQLARCSGGLCVPVLE